MSTVSHRSKKRTTEKIFSYSVTGAISLEPRQGLISGLIWQEKAVSSSVGYLLFFEDFHATRGWTRASTDAWCPMLVGVTEIEQIWWWYDQWCLHDIIIIIITEMKTRVKRLNTNRSDGTFLIRISQSVVCLDIPQWFPSSVWMFHLQTASREVYKQYRFQISKFQ